MAGLDEPNFDLFTAFKLDFLDDKRIAAADSQSNKTIFTGFSFCRVDEAHTRRMKNEKVAVFCTLAKKLRYLIT